MDGIPLLFLVYKHRILYIDWQNQPREVCFNEHNWNWRVLWTFPFDVLQSYWNATKSCAPFGYLCYCGRDRNLLTENLFSFCKILIIINSKFCEWPEMYFFFLFISHSWQMSCNLKRIFSLNSRWNITDNKCNKMNALSIEIIR